MIHFHLLEVSRIVKETDDCVVITLGIPEELKDVFSYKAGQNITIRQIINGEERRRNYSICTSPFDEDFKIGVKQVSGGLFSTYANSELKEGDFLEVMPPTGSFFTELHPAQQKNYIAFAAGSGITPVLSLVKTTLQTEPRSSFTLVYGNRNKNSIIFKEELQALKDKYLHRFNLIHILSREAMDAPLNSGKIDKEKCSLLFGKLINIRTIDDFFLCGPEQMIFCVKDFLEEKGVSKTNIHFELFTVPGINKTMADTKQLATYTGDRGQITVRLDGISFSFELGYNEESILDAALDAGADLPYACKGGVCTTCKARLKEGRVEMTNNWGLDDEEIEEGFVLTCQAHPLTKRVFIDFDDR
jgi:ring-1,2-phenylacetyl-CoA epoxidase subunit PaaE